MAVKVWQLEAFFEVVINIGGEKALQEPHFSLFMLNLSAGIEQRVVVDEVLG